MDKDERVQSLIFIFTCFRESMLNIFFSMQVFHTLFIIYRKRCNFALITIDSRKRE